MSALAVMPSRSRPAALVATVALGALALVGCSSSTGPEAAATAASSSQFSGASATGAASAAAEETPTSSAPAAGSTADATTSEATDPVSADEPVIISTPVPPPAGAGTGGDVPEVEVTTAAAVPLTATAELGDVSTVITNVSALTTTATGPGEIAGPAVAVQVQLKNNSGAPVSLDSVFVSLNDSDGAPGQPTTSDPARPVSGELGPGAQADGVYVFRVSTAGRNPITILVSNSDSAEVVSFVGAAA